MSTSDKLNRILQSKSDIKDAIIEKGGVVNDSTPLKDYAQAIRDLPSGSPEYTSNYTLTEDRGVLIENNKYAVLSKDTAGMLTSNTDVNDLSNCQEFIMDIRFILRALEHYKVIANILTPEASSYYDDSQSLFAILFDSRYRDRMYFLIGDGTWRIADYITNYTMQRNHEYRLRIEFNKDTGYKIYIQDFTTGDEDLTLIYENTNTFRPKLRSDLTQALFSLGSHTFHSPQYNSWNIYILPECSLTYKTEAGVDKLIKFVE